MEVEETGNPSEWKDTEVKLAYDDDSDCCGHGKLAARDVLFL